MAMEQLVAVIDANGVRSGRVDPNIEVLEEDGFLVLRKVKLMISAEQAAALTSRDPEPRDFLTGPVVALLLKRKNAYRALDIIRSDLDDFYASCDAWSTLRDCTVFFPTPAVLERSLVVIKPDHSRDDINTVLDVLESNDFIVLDKQIRTMSPEMARNIFGDIDQVVDYMSSGESVCLAVEKVGAIDEFTLLMGPSDPVLAKEIAPRSLRAVLGVRNATRSANACKNAVYGSPTAAKAEKDLADRFPHPFSLQRTLAIVKPDIIQNGYLSTAMALIADNGFSILASETMTLSAERAEVLYAEHQGRPFFNDLVAYMSSGPILAMVLCKPQAIAAWRRLIGPADVEQAKSEQPSSLRARFGTDFVLNGFHGSYGENAAKREIDAFFPELSVEKIPNLLEVENLLNAKPAPRPHVEPKKSLNDVLVEGLTQLCRIKPVGGDAVTWLGEWLLRNNPNKPTVEAPEEVEEELSVRETVAAGADVNQKTSIIWAIGAQGSGKDEQCAYIVKKFGYEFIDVNELMASTEQSGNEFGEVIKECKRANKAVPTHITNNLIKNAVLSCTGSTKFLINNFPSSLDEAFDFEKAMGPVDMVLYFDCSTNTRQQRMEAAGETGSAGDTVKSFKNDIFPVIDHYSAFSKIAKISTDGTEAQVTSRVHRIFR